MNNTNPPVQIACFISPHGYGHAARASAVMSAVHNINPAVSFKIFTQVPQWFFDESVAASFTYHTLLTDIGLVQKNSLQEDLPATIRQLNNFLPFSSQLIATLAKQVTACRLVLCDIAPLGIAVAQAAGIPSLLVENFTWNWIYQGYPTLKAPLKYHIATLQKLFTLADYHIQTEPVCVPHPANLRVGPISRKTKEGRATVRGKLGVAKQDRVIVLTMGGTNWDYTILERLHTVKDVCFIIAGGKNEMVETMKNLIILPRNSNIYHPDLINAADAVIGKVGYSTLAEVHQAGIPFGYVARSQFKESPFLVSYIQANMPGLEFTEAEFKNGDWLLKLPKLLSLQKNGGAKIPGNDEVAAFINNLVLGENKNR